MIRNPMENLSLVHRGLLFALPLLTAGCAATTVGNGVMAEQGECVDMATESTLEDGQAIYVGIEDISFYEGDEPHDEIRLANEAGRLTISGYTDTNEVEVWGEGAAITAKPESTEVAFFEEGAEAEIKLQESARTAQLTAREEGDRIVITSEQNCPKE
jgi:hypothetical protein